MVTSLTERALFTGHCHHCTRVQVPELSEIKQPERNHHHACICAVDTDIAHLSSVLG